MSGSAAETAGPRRPELLDVSAVSAPAGASEGRRGGPETEFGPRVPNALERGENVML